ncbi:MAG TPA: hypothetical protein VGH15_05910 [Caulobacteraceae bacterium]|jgi:hypothetical protein
MAANPSAADTVTAWFQERIATGEIARNTPAYNQVFEALPDLIDRLSPTAKIVAKSPPPAESAESEG